MPVRPDAPLRKVTLNLYEADCIALEQWHGHGWSTYIRDLVHSDINRNLGIINRAPRTLGDLADD